MLFDLHLNFCHKKTMSYYEPTPFELQVKIGRIKKQLASLRKLWLLEKKNRDTLALQGKIWKILLSKYENKLEKILSGNKEISFEEAKKILTSVTK